MLNRYLMVDISVLPDDLLKVVEVRRMLDAGRYKSVSEAVKAVGISRSTYYKYRDRILEPQELGVGRRATLMLTLAHEAGMLSRVLSVLSECGANILTITQSPPVHQRAGIMLTLDLEQSRLSVEELLERLQRIPGTERVRLLAVE